MHWEFDAVWRPYPSCMSYVQEWIHANATDAQAAVKTSASTFYQLVVNK